MCHRESERAHRKGLLALCHRHRRRRRPTELLMMTTSSSSQSVARTRETGVQLMCNVDSYLPQSHSHIDIGRGIPQEGVQSPPSFRRSSSTQPTSMGGGGASAHSRPTQETLRICLHGVSLLSGRWFTFFAATVRVAVVPSVLAFFRRPIAAVCIELVC